MRVTEPRQNPHKFLQTQLLTTTALSRHLD
jgi:hypothetical protein